MFKLRRRTRRILLLAGLMLIAVLALWGLIHVGVNLWRATSSGGDLPTLREETVAQVDPDEYETLWVGSQTAEMGPLILVNNEHPYGFGQEDTLMPVYDGKTGDYKVRSVDVLVQEEIMEPLNRMFAGYCQATGSHEVNILSAYRSYEDQVSILAQKEEELGEEEARRWASLPGGSEHHTGYAMDLGIYTDGGWSKDFTGKGEQSWLTSHACQYGFVLRYAQEKEGITGIAHEPWHFRYVGKPHAQLMAQQNLCLEEYLQQLQNYPFGQQHLQVTGEDGSVYEIYYEVLARDTAQIHVPRGKDYWISGDNMGGVIVTVCRKTEE